MFNIYRKKEEIDKNKYFLAKYYIQSSTDLADAAWNLAIGQSVGNPNVRSEFETDKLFEEHSCLVVDTKENLQNKKEGPVTIAFPETNISFDTDGINHLLVQVMGGQCDIDIFDSCVLTDLELTPNMLKCLKGPYYGIKGMKKFCGVSKDKPLLGGITKPKVGLRPQKHLELVKQLVDGGCNFIKEDEIMSDPSWSRIEDRVGLVTDYIKTTGGKVFYSVSIHCDPLYLQERLSKVVNLDGNSVFINHFCSLGSYKSIRDIGHPLLLHFHKSGDKVINYNKHLFHINERVMFDLASKAGADTLHCGMIGGYMDNDTDIVLKNIKTINDNNAIPALSCGMHPGIVNYVSDIVGHGNWMANVGGALTGHPSGTYAGAKAMRQAIDGETNGKEYKEAIQKWGKK